MIESQKSNFERTVLVGVINDSQSEEKLNEFLEELEFLSFTAGGKVLRKFKQRIKKMFAPGRTKFCADSGMKIGRAHV